MNTTKAMEQRDFEIGLQKHLRKCELEYRAEMLPNGSNVDWLEPYCTDVKSIAELIRGLGFRIAWEMDEEEFRPGWVVTTSGVVVYTNSGRSSGGLVAKAGK